VATYHDLIEAALRKIGRLGSGDSASTTERSDAVLELNRMLGSWSAKIGPLYFETTESLTWTSGSASMTIGSGGALDTSRPLEILTAQIRSGTMDFDLGIITHQQYQAIPDKATTSSLPQYLAYNATYASGLGTLFMWPVPSGSQALRLTSKKPLADAVGASTVTLPPAWEDAIVLNLAVRFADGDYAADIPVTLRQAAIAAFRTIVISNIVLQPGSIDPLTPGLSRGTVSQWNIP
jgi:hypothetical protein